MKSVRGFRIILFVFAMLLISCQPRQTGSLQINNAWSRQGLAGGNSALYFTVENRSSQSDSLIKAESNAAETVELHLSSMDESGTMSMHQQMKIEIPAGENVEFKPGGLHVMLINLNNDLLPGQKVNATLTFEKAGEINLEITVQEP
jgi:periplasmic copper chaperone A